MTKKGDRAANQFCDGKHMMLHWVNGRHERNCYFFILNKGGIDSEKEN